MPTAIIEFKEQNQNFDDKLAMLGTKTKQTNKKHLPNLQASSSAICKIQPQLDQSFSQRVYL